MAYEAMGDDVYQPDGSEVQDDAGLLDVSDTLDDRGIDEALDEGYSPPEKPWGVEHNGVTAAERQRGRAWTSGLPRRSPMSPTRMATVSGTFGTATANSSTTRWETCERAASSRRTRRSRGHRKGPDCLRRRRRRGGRIGRGGRDARDPRLRVLLACPVRRLSGVPGSTSSWRAWFDALLAWWRADAGAPRGGRQRWKAAPKRAPDTGAARGAVRSSPTWSR